MLGSKVLVLVEPKAEKDGLILTPDTVANRGTLWGVVISMGKGKLMPNGLIRPLPEEIKPGVRVLINNVAQHGELKIDGTYYTTVDGFDILGYWGE